MEDKCCILTERTPEVAAACKDNRPDFSWEIDKSHFLDTMDNHTVIVNQIASGNLYDNGNTAFHILPLDMPHNTACRIQKCLIVADKKKSVCIIIFSENALKDAH